MGGFLLFLYYHQDALLIADTGRNILLAESLSLGHRSFHQDAGEHILAVALVPVDLFLPDDRKVPVVVLPDTEQSCFVAVDMEHYYYAVEQVHYPGVVALEHYYYAVEQVRYPGVVALEHCCYAAEQARYCCVAEWVRYPAVAEPSHCYAVLQSAHHLPIAVWVDVALPLLYCWPVEGPLHFHPVLQQLMAAVEHLMERSLPYYHCHSVYEPLFLADFVQFDGVLLV